MIAAIIQARMGSTRLPGKVLKKLNGKSLIENIVLRVRHCTTVDEILVATTTNKLDDELEQWCFEHQIKCYRGDEKDVLKRYFDAASFINADVIIRITADDPFKDPKVIDAVVKQLIDNNLDFSFNNFPPTFPEGLDTEVFTYEAIKKAMESNTTDFEKEHVTQYFYHNPNDFRMMNYSYTKDVSDIRLTVDSKEDFLLAEEIYSKLAPNGEMFYLEDVLRLMEAHPDLMEINQNVKRSAMYAKENNKANDKS